MNASLKWYKWSPVFLKEVAKYFRHYDRCVSRKKKLLLAMLDNKLDIPVKHQYSSDLHVDH